MRIAIRYIMLVLCMLFSCALLAQGNEKALLSLDEESEGVWRLEFVSGNMTMRDVGAGDMAIDVAGMVCQAHTEGLPSLPTASHLLLLPRGADVRIEGEVESREEVVALSFGQRVRPFLGATIKDVSMPYAEPDKAVYNVDVWYRAGDPVTIENLGTMGERQVVRITVNPVAYNPVRGELLHSTYLLAKLVIHQSALLASNTMAPERYLIVSRPQFREGLRPFIRWKRQQGYEVNELYADTNQRDSIKALISSQWAVVNGQTPRYLLLVGDVEQIQAFPGTTHPAGLSNHITDLYYAEHTGDYLPDALVGRWTVNDTAELNAVVRKTLAYEQFVGIDTSLLRRVLLVAGAESQEPAPITTNGQVNYVGREIKLAHPSLDTLCYRNPASAEQRNAILGDLRQGAAMLNYTAHCTSSGWSSPSVSFSSIDTLENNQPLLYVNNCCLSNAFGGTCFGEQLLRKPVGGAIGVIGATNSTLWNEDYYWVVGPKYPFSIVPLFDGERLGAFDRWVGRSEGVQNQGELLAAGNLAVTAFGSPYDKFYWETYCLLGEPSLEPWVGIPQMIDIYFTNGTPSDGAGCIYMGGTVGAMVTAMQRDTVLGRGTIGSNGLLTLQLCQSIDTTPLVLTATACGYRPRIDTLGVVAVNGMGVALRGISVTDSTVVCRVENVGTVPFYGLRIVLSQQNVDSTRDALLEEQQTVIDTLLPQHWCQVTLPVYVTTVGQTPEWEAQLFAWDSVEGILCCLTLRRSVEIDYPSATFNLVEADSSDAHSLQSRHVYRLETRMEGLLDSVNLTLTALPTGDTLTTTFTSPDTLTHLHLEASLGLGNHHTIYNYFMIGGHRIDGFEEGFGSYPWQSGGTQPWYIDSAMSHSGRFCVRSGAIDYRQTSDLVLEVLLPHSDTLSYWARTSSEVRYDKLQFSVDGVLRGTEMWGESGWNRYATVLAAGHHTLRWRYVKDERGSAGSDCAWIDDVQLPLALWDSAYGWFGDTSMLGVHTTVPAYPLYVYPNPTRGAVIVDGANSGLLQVMDLYGRVVYSSCYMSPFSYNLDFLSDGIYLLQVVSSVGSAHCTLIIRH